MKLQLFNGGKNTRLAPHLISVNEAVEYTNIDNESGSLVPVKRKKDISTILLEFSHYFTVINQWVSSATSRDYVEYKNTLYFTEDGTNPKKTTDNINFYNLGIVAPTVPTTALGAAGVLTGTYQYVITFYNSSDGAESAISPITTELVATSDSINITSIPISTDPQVDKKRIYRLGGDLTLFTLVTTIDNIDTSYNDNIADTAVEGTLLESSNFNPAPSGLKFLTEHYGIFIGALNDKVYFTPVGKPNAWPTLNFIDFDSDITGIGKIFNGIIVCTKLKSYVITGTNVNSFVKSILSETQGCKKHKSMKHLSDGRLLWVSNDGVCSSKGSKIDIISKDKLGKVDLDVKNAVVHDEIYYLQKTDKTILAVDTRYGLVFKDFDLTTTNLVVANDILYGFENNNLYEMFNDTVTESITWLSPVIIEGEYTNLKHYKKIYIRSEGSFTLEIFTDGVSVFTGSYTGTDTHEVKVPADTQDGYSIQLKITGTATIREIAFKPLNRKSD